MAATRALSKSWTCLFSSSARMIATDAEFPPLTPEQLEAELLKGVRSPHRPWEQGKFRKLAER